MILIKYLKSIHSKQHWIFSSEVVFVVKYISHHQNLEKILNIQSLSTKISSNNTVPRLLANISTEKISLHFFLHSASTCKLVIYNIFIYTLSEVFVIFFITIQNFLPVCVISRQLVENLYQLISVLYSSTSSIMFPQYKKSLSLSIS